jgi:O-antigen ligase
MFRSKIILTRLKLIDVLFYINLVLVLLITLFNQRQDMEWPFVLVYIFISFFILLSNRKNFIFKKTVPFYASLLYFFITGSILNHSLIDWPEYLILSLFPVILYQTSFYLFNKKFQRVNQLVIIVIVIVLFAAYKVYTTRALLVELNSNSIQTNWTNVIGACLPFVFLIKNRKLQFLFVSFCAFFIIVGLKRTGMVSVILTVLILVFFKTKDNKVFFNLKGALIAFFLFLVVFVTFFKDVEFDYLVQATNRLENVAEDGGSGRDELIAELSVVWLDFYKTPMQNKFFGFGYNGVKLNSGLPYESAHNDVFDFAFDYGIFAVILLLTFYARLLYLIVREWSRRNQYFPFILCTSALFFIYSSLSGLYHFFFFFVPLIICLALIESILQQSTQQKHSF